MKNDTELKFFFKPGCPYCRRAEKLIAELCAAKPEYAAVKIRRIDETAEAQLAESFDYWYVPSFFLGDEKLYEADPAEDEETVRAKLTAVFDRALRA